MLRYVYYYLEEQNRIQIVGLATLAEWNGITFKEFLPEKMGEIEFPDEAIFLSDNIKQAEEKKREGIPVTFLELGETCYDSGIGIRYIFKTVEAVTREYLTEVYCREHRIPLEILETRRCKVREIDERDLERLYEIYAVPQITQYMEPLFANRQDELDYIRSYIDTIYPLYGFGMWVIMEKVSNRVIGRAGFEVKDDYPNGIELGFIIAEEYQRQGFAYEVCSAILQFASEKLDFEFAYSEVIPENIASIRLCEKLGFTFRGEKLLEGKKYFEYGKSLK